MLHLFGKKYVCLDYLLDTSKKRIVVSSNEGLWQQANLSPLKHAVKDFSALVGPTGVYKTWHEFLLSLEYEDKLRMYVDQHTFNTIAVYWLKTIFPNISKENAFCCYNAYVQRLNLHFPAIVLNRSFLDYNKETLATQKFMSKQDFYDLFDRSHPWSDDAVRHQWVMDHIDEFSFEWQIAHYFNDNKHISRFREKYIYVLTKALSVEVSEWYQYIVRYFMQPNVKKLVGIDIKWDDENWREKLQQHPKIGFMFDPQLKYITKDTAYFLAHIDKALEVGLFLQEFWFKDIIVDDKIRLLDKDYFESDHAHFTFDTLKKLVANQDKLTDQHLEEIIKTDFDRERTAIIFDLLNHVTKWNTYLLQYVYELKNTNDPKLKELRFS